MQVPLSDDNKIFLAEKLFIKSPVGLIRGRNILEQGTKTSVGLVWMMEHEGIHGNGFTRKNYQSVYT